MSKIKVKTDLVFLGFVRRIQYADFKKGQNTVRAKLQESLLQRTDKKVLGLFVTSDAKTLYCIPWVNPKVNDAPRGFELQKKVFERWANMPASQAIQIHIPAIANLQHVGFIEEIEYTSDKFERSGDNGTFNLYMHEFETSPALYVNCPLRPYMWAIDDPKGRKLMTYRGLVL